MVWVCPKCKFMNIDFQTKCISCKCKRIIDEVNLGKGNGV